MYERETLNIKTSFTNFKKWVKLGYIATQHHIILQTNFQKSILDGLAKIFKIDFQILSI